MKKPVVTGNYNLVKKINRSLVLRTIREKGPLSRADIAAITELNPVTVSNMVTELLEAKLVEEKGPGLSSGGRRPISIDLNPRDRFVIGVDLAVTELRVIVANLKGEIVERAGMQIDFREGPNPILEKTVVAVEKAINNCGLSSQQILGLGLDIPGILDKDRGYLLFSPNLPSWRDVPVKRFLQERFPFPIYIENDANAAALGEQWFGVGKGVDNLIFILADIGIGSGIILNKQIYGGRDNGAGEIGHTVVEINGPKCNCGSYGCLEAVASGIALIKKASEHIATGARSRMREIVDGNPDLLTLDIVKEAARQGDELAIEMISESAEYIGVATASVINLFNPEKIVLGGRLASDNDILIQTMKRSVEQRAFSFLAKGVEIIYSQLGEDVRVIGAATLVLRDIFSAPSLSG